MSENGFGEKGVAPGRLEFSPEAPLVTALRSIDYLIQLVREQSREMLIARDRIESLREDINGLLGWKDRAAELQKKIYTLEGELIMLRKPVSEPLPFSSEPLP